MYAVGVRARVHRAGRLRSERERRARGKANKVWDYVAEPKRFLRACRVQCSRAPRAHHVHQYRETKAIQLNPARDVPRVPLPRADYRSNKKPAETSAGMQTAFKLGLNWD